MPKRQRETRPGELPAGFAANPHPILPEQFYEQRPLQAEKRLLWAVLADAVDEMMKHCLRQNLHSLRIFAAEWSWFFDESDDKRVCSFEVICSHLGLEPKYIQRGLIQFLLHRACELEKPRPP